MFVFLLDVDIFFIEINIFRHILKILTILTTKSECQELERETAEAKSQLEADELAQRFLGEILEVI